MCCFHQRFLRNKQYEILNYLIFYKRMVQGDLIVLFEKFNILNIILNKNFTDTHWCSPKRKFILNTSMNGRRAWENNSGLSCVAHFIQQLWNPFIYYFSSRVSFIRRVFFRTVDAFSWWCLGVKLQSTNLRG